MGIIQAAMIGIAGIILIMQVKNGKSEYAIYLTIGISLLLFGGMSGKLGQIAEIIKRIGDAVNIDDMYMQTLMKMLGIVYVSEFAAAICKDAGYQTIAAQIEIFAKLTILVLSLPILEALLSVIQNFLS